MTAKRRTKKQRLLEVFDTYAAMHGNRPCSTHEVALWAIIEGLWPVPTQSKADAEFGESWDIRLQQVKDRIAKGGA